MIISNIAILIAMREEANPILNQLKMDMIADGFDNHLPFELYKGIIEEREVHLVIGGKDKVYNVDNIATQPATLSAHVTIEKIQPDLIINAGTAGGFKKRGANIGTVYISSDQLKYHDRRIPIPGYREYGIGAYPSLKTDRMAQELNLVPGIISTGNSLDLTDNDLEIIQSNNADVKDMEAAAIAWVAMLHGKPFLALKAITDLIDTDSPTQEEFLENLSIASKNLGQAIIEVSKYCLNKPLSEL
jgi:5'-methylthioadenosine/S-adenosylhomocysteine nucleosidase